MESNRACGQQATEQLGSQYRLQFGLRLADPIERCLDEYATWRGVAGGYVLTLGPFVERRGGCGWGAADTDSVSGGFHPIVAGRAPSDRARQDG